MGVSVNRCSQHGAENSGSELAKSVPPKLPSDRPGSTLLTLF